MEGIHALTSSLSSLTSGKLHLTTHGFLVMLMPSSFTYKPWLSPEKMSSTARVFPQQKSFGYLPTPKFSLFIYVQAPYLFPQPHCTYYGAYHILL